MWYPEWDSNGYSLHEVALGYGYIECDTKPFLPFEVARGYGHMKLLTSRNFDNMKIESPYLTWNSAFFFSDIRKIYIQSKYIIYKYAFVTANMSQPFMWLVTHKQIRLIIKSLFMTVFWDVVTTEQ